MPAQKTEEMARLARKQGRLVLDAVEQMVKEHGGQMTSAGGMLIAAFGEAAQNWWDLSLLGNLQWTEASPSENQHIEVIVMDADDRRMIPCLSVDVTVMSETGDDLGTKRQRMFWSPTAYHYGANWSIPGEGLYDIRVHVGLPEFPRHDKELGRRFTQPVNVLFRGFHLRPGRE